MYEITSNSTILTPDGILENVTEVCNKLESFRGIESESEFDGC